MFGSRVGRNAAARGLFGVLALIVGLSLTSLAPVAQAAPGAPPGSASLPLLEVQTAVPAGPHGLGSVHPLIAPPVPLVPPQVLASINVAGGPSVAAFDAGNGYVYEANSLGNSVSILNGISLVATVPVATLNASVGDPVNVTYDPSNGFVYVVDRYNFESPGGAVSVFAGTSIVATVPVGLRPATATYDASNGYVYVTNSADASVSVLHGVTVVGTIPVGANPAAGAYDPVHGYVYVANRGSGNVSVISGSSVVASLFVGVDPAALRYDPAAGSVYVANNGSGNVSLLSGTSVLGSVATGANPSFVLFDPATANVYVTDRNASDVVVLAGLLPVATVPTSAGPVWAAYGPTTGFVYIADFAANDLTVLNGLTPLGTVTVGTSPSSAVWDPGHSYVYVTDSDSHNVSVVAIAYGVEFNETGLPSGASWSVTLGSRPATTTGSSILFGELPATLNYSATGPAGYRLISATPGSPITVTDAGILVNLAFARASNATYALTFVETGLRSSCGGSPQWSVTVNNTTETSTSNRIGFSEPNGTYSYVISGPWGYTVVSSVPVSPVTINGSAVTVQVTFSKGGGTSSWTLTFSESGLRPGTTWCVTVGATLCSGSGEIRFSGLASGTYSFTVSPVSGYTAQPSAGTVTIAGQNVIVRIQFTAQGGSHHCGGGGGGGHGGHGGHGGGDGGW